MKRSVFRSVLAVFRLLLVVAVFHGAQGARAADTSLAAGAIAPVDDAWRASLPRDPEAATQAYMARLSPAAKARSDAYAEGGYWLLLWNFIYGLAVAALLLRSRISAKVRNLAERISRRKTLQTLLYGVTYIAGVWLLTLPLAIYQGFFREREYGLLNQTFGPWFGEQLVALGVTMVLGGLLIAAVYAVIRRAPRTWWAWGALVGVAFIAFAALIEPIYIDPLFNAYTPVADGPVKAAVLSMARANGVPAEDIYEFDASKQTDRISANVSGLFGTTAIRLNDNLLRRTTLPEIKGVMAHELGHYVLDHIYRFIVAFGVICVVGFALVRLVVERIISLRGERWGVRGVDDAAGLPLLVAAFSGYLLLMTPITNTLIRVQETQADLFGLNVAREPDGFAEVDLKLTEYRKSDPGPIEEFIFYDHPSPRKRIYHAMRWKAENQN